MAIACVCPGPSLTREACERLVGRARVLVVSNAFELCPEADWLYACEQPWWEEFHTAAFAGERWTASQMAAQRYGLRHAPLLPEGKAGLSAEPYQLARGGHGGYQALNLALHFAREHGEREIWLLGYDLRAVNGRQHFFGEYAQPRLARSTRPYGRWAAAYNSICPADHAGVEIYNLTPGSAIRRFPFRSLDDALRTLPQAA